MQAEQEKEFRNFKMEEENYFTVFQYDTRKDAEKVFNQYQQERGILESILSPGDVYTPAMNWDDRTQILASSSQTESLKQVSQEVLEG